MKLLLDNRENLLHGTLQVPHEYVPLDIGDVQIKGDDDQMLCIIERKTIQDLCASIKDGRYKEQKIRLLSLRQSHPLSIVYIIEGKFSFDESITVCGLTNKTLVSALVHTSMRDKVHVFHTTSLLDTANAIESIWSRLPKMMMTPPEEGVVAYMEASIKPQKKANITQQTVLVSQLAAIPNISVTKAQLIIQHLNVTSIHGLLQKGNFDPQQLHDQLIAIHGIGKVIAKGVVQYLFAPEN